MKILVVDDDENSRVFLERALRAQHYDVETAVNGGAALERTSQWRPDLIISDILMPVMNGFELCRRIKTDEHLRAIPFIFYTATFVDQRDEKLAMALGASRFLVKPMDPDDFFSIVKEVLHEYETDSLAVPHQPLAEMKDLCQMQAEALARKLEVTGRLAGEIGHDFNNMLTAIMGYSEILKMDLEGDSRSRHYVDLILDAAKKAADLAQEILAFRNQQTTCPNKTDSARTD
ncbi:MAG TPA: response regulator [Thermodesulfovibrionales bacterium]|nr:response regulator [Thermodesulfovibrionales bacterium]